LFILLVIPFTGYIYLGYYEALKLFFHPFQQNQD
jgi:hypothetical protein